jgi:hypothetical protein
MIDDVDITRAGETGGEMVCELRRTPRAAGPQTIESLRASVKFQGEKPDPDLT